MITTPPEAFDPTTHRALSEVALEPGSLTLKAPINSEGEIILGRLELPPDYPSVLLTIAVQDGAISVEREDGTPINIRNEYSRPHAKRVLAQAVGQLTVCHSPDGWITPQNPDSLVN